MTSRPVTISLDVVPEDVKCTKCVGEGMYGKVWKANWYGKGGGIVVAVKKIPVHANASFARAELGILQELRHPNIVSLYGACFTQQELWIVMEYIEGGNLYDLLHSERSLSWAIRLHLAHQAILSVNALHCQVPSILHRDIKSLNFLVSQDLKTLKITDFGMSKIAGTTKSFREVVGTFLWSAPETVTTDNVDWTTKADIYSLGITLFEIASDELPYEMVDGETFIRLELPPDCPEDFAKLILSCCSKEPEDRPSTSSLLKIFERILSSPPDNLPKLMRRISSTFKIGAISLHDISHKQLVLPSQQTNNISKSSLNLAYLNLHNPNLSVEIESLCIATRYGLRFKDMQHVTNLVRTKTGVDNDGNTLLHIACQKNYFSLAEALLDAGADICALNSRKQTPLHWAALENALESVVLLVSRGAPVNAQDEDGLMALHSACIRPESFTIVLRLLEAGTDPNIGDAELPLHTAAYHGNVNALKKLIEVGAQVREKPLKLTALHYAAFNGQLECLNILLSHGADPHAVDKERSTPLHKGAFVGRVEVVKRLLEVGADPNSRDYEGATPLHKAAFSGHADVVVELLARGAEIDAQDSENGTALHNAAYGGHFAIVKILLLNKANINCVDCNGCSPLHLAVIQGREQCALFLLQSGAEITMDIQGGTPLHRAIAHPRCVSLLMDHGCEVDALDKNGRTPLFFALEKSITESSRILLVHKANLHLKDSSRISPYDIASAEMKKFVESVLEEQTKKKTGFLFKQGGRIKTWKRRWIVLKEGSLYYFKDQSDVIPCGIVTLENLVVLVATKGTSRKYCFELCAPDGNSIKSVKIQNGILVQGHHEAYLFAAKTQKEMEEWVTSIHDAILSNPFHQLTAKRQLQYKGKVKERELNEKEDYKEHVNFSMLHDMANMCAMGYANTTSIKEAYDPATVILQGQFGLLGYFIVHPQSRSQTVVLCCSLWATASPWLKARLVQGEKIDNTDFAIKETFQVDKQIEFLENNVTKFLNIEYTTLVLGHSLGGFIALIYAQIILSKGFKVQLTTFGQPKLLRSDQAEKFNQVQHTRVMAIRDPIPRRLTGFVHVGTMVALRNAGIQGDGEKNITIEESMAFNDISHYLKLLKTMQSQS